MNPDRLRLDSKSILACRRDRKNLATTSPTMAFKSTGSFLPRCRGGVGPRQGQQLIGRVRQLPYSFLQRQQTPLDRQGRRFGGQQIQLRPAFPVIGVRNWCCGVAR